MTVGLAAACQAAIQVVLQAGAQVSDPHTGRPVFAFRLHQFLRVTMPTLPSSCRRSGAV